MEDLDLITTECKECYYFKEIIGAKTCGLYHRFLEERAVGCLGGWKVRNVEAEEMVKNYSKQ